MVDESGSMRGLRESLGEWQAAVDRTKAAYAAQRAARRAVTEAKRELVDLFGRLRQEGRVPPMHVLAELYWNEPEFPKAAIAAALGVHVAVVHRHLPSSEETFTGACRSCGGALERRRRSASDAGWVGPFCGDCAHAESERWAADRERKSQEDSNLIARVHRDGQAVASRQSSWLPGLDEVTILVPGRREDAR